MMLDAVPDVIVRLDLEGRYCYVNATTGRVAGIPPEEFLGKTPRELGMPGDLCDLWDRTLHRLVETRQTEVIEFAYPGPEGETFWEERWFPELRQDGSVQSVVAIGRDITEKKRLEKVAEAAHEQIRLLASSLLTAQEDERQRISRELHDDLCQRMAALAIEIGGMIAEVRSPRWAHERLVFVQRRVVEMAEMVRTMAYQLHPQILDDLGLVAAVRDLCSGFSGRGKAVITFTTAGQFSAISKESAFCVYRIVQEALHNVRHSGAEHVQVSLKNSRGILKTSVQDDGAGFDVTQRKGKGGLGLISMEERARLMNGTLCIDARPGHGTRIILDLPLSSDVNIDRDLKSAAR